MDIQFYNVKDEPFTVDGLYHDKEENAFKRMPDHIAAATSANVAYFNRHTAGGRVRFRTDSSQIIIKPQMPSLTLFPHMALTGSSCFDLYLGEGGASTFCQSFKPPQDYYGMVDPSFYSEYESVLKFKDSRMREITINFPLYNEVRELSVGLDISAAVEKSGGYRYPKPILFYGSSITQGACASRPGSCYTAILSRRLDCDHINFGFSGSALGEEAIVDYISSLDISVFVCDYDHNAPDVQYLSATHGRLYHQFREKKRDVPVIFISKPDFDADKALNAERRAVIYGTYAQAVRDGDQNVYFVDGETLFDGKERDNCTVDTVHPNDLGFMRMADIIESTLKKALISTTSTKSSVETGGRSSETAY
jgi:hypothetical protein